MWKLEEKKPLFSANYCKVLEDLQKPSREFVTTCYRLILVGTSLIGLRITTTSLEVLEKMVLHCVRLRSMVAGSPSPISDVPDLHSSSSANSCVNSTSYNKPPPPPPHRRLDYTVWGFCFPKSWLPTILLESSARGLNNNSVKVRLRFYI